MARVGCSDTSTAAPTATPAPAATSSTVQPSTPATVSPADEQLVGPRVELPGGLLLKQVGKVAQYGLPDDKDMSH